MTQKLEDIIFLNSHTITLFYGSNSIEIYFYKLNKKCYNYKMKKKKTIRLLIIVILFIFILGGIHYSQAFSYNINQGLDSLNQKIKNQQASISQIKVKQAKLQAEINKKQKDSISLKNQIVILDDNIKKVELDIEFNNLKIDKTNLEIEKLKIDSNNLDKKISQQKQHISNLLKLIYKQDQITTLESLLLNDSLADFINQTRYLEDANQQISKNVEKLKLDKKHLDENKESLDSKTKELLTLRKNLEDKKDSLAYEKKNKAYILEETKSLETKYQSLLKKAKQDQAQAEREILSTERLIRQKMSERDRNKLNSGDSIISWPIPKNYIVCGFHDPDYPYRHIIGEHPAIDIRAAQGTTLKAAADGYVAKVRFNKNSRRYAYIMIIHKNGLSTVYGHVSAVYVKTDQYVHRGQIIGKTGGTPGSAGAGRFTTGPHLHFEVRKNGLPVNPLNYLP